MPTEFTFKPNRTLKDLTYRFGWARAKRFMVRDYLDSVAKWEAAQSNLAQG